MLRSKLTECPCPKKCKNHGDCDACVAHHKTTYPKPPFCDRTPEEQELTRAECRAQDEADAALKK